MISFLVALVAFCLGVASATYFAMRQTDVAALNDHIDDIRQVEALASSYWLGEEDDERKRDIVGHRLRGKLHTTALFRGSYAKVLGAELAEYKRLEGDLFDLATGGNFQTADFKPDPKVANAIMTNCNEMRILLRRVRKHIYWFH